MLDFQSKRECQVLNTSIIVRADWDAEASVWVATSTDIRGLAVEAASLELLQTKVMAAVADLIELNRSPSHLPEIPVHIMASQIGMAANPHSSWFKDSQNSLKQP